MQDEDVREFYHSISSAIAENRMADFKSELSLFVQNSLRENGKFNTLSFYRRILAMAVECDAVDAARHLVLDLKVDINPHVWMDRAERGPRSSFLGMAINQHKNKVARFFIEEGGADLDTPDLDGNRQIHYICEKNNGDLLPLVLLRCRNLHVANDKGQEPRDLIPRFSSVKQMFDEFLIEFDARREEAEAEAKLGLEIATLRARSREVYMNRLEKMQQMKGKGIKIPKL